MKNTNNILRFFVHPSLQGLLFLFLLCLSHLSLVAQNKVEQKEEIKITSSFKPSIIRKGKIINYATPPEKDSSAFTFKYGAPEINTKTFVKSFTINPLDVNRNELLTDSSGFFAKAGYGNIQNPLVQLAYENDKPNSNISVWANHVSSKGMLTDQSFANSSFGAYVDSKISEYQKLNFNVGYNLDMYRQYGYDHALFNFTDDKLKQQFSNFHAAVSFSSISGNEKKSIFSPLLYFSNLSTAKKANESTIAVVIPFSKQFNDKMTLSIKPRMDLVFFSGSRDSSKMTSVIQLPLRASAKSTNLTLDGGFNTVLTHSGVKLLPLLDFNYTPSSSVLSLFVEIANKASVNSFHFLSSQNPFIVTPDSITTFQEVEYNAGIKIALKKQLLIKLSGGYANFMNLPLYLNAVLSGKDLKAVYEPVLNAFKFKAELGYTPTTHFDFKASVIAYNLYGQINYQKAYGFIPIELNADLSWKPIQTLKLHSKLKIWKGAWAFSESKTNHLLNNAADLNLGVEYDLNKKWGIWLDLNNIANVKYERWSQYSSFGFNVIGGVRFHLFKTKFNN